MILRRVELDRESLLSKIARVIESPPKSEVFILSRDPSAEEAQRFIIDDSPTSIPVKGMSFTVAPSTLEQEIAGCLSLADADSRNIPPPSLLWKWYEQRKGIAISKQMRIEVARLCLISDVPAFFWMQGCSSEVIKPMLIEAAKHGLELATLAATAAFLGKGFFKQFLAHVGQKATKFPQRLQRYPAQNIFDVFGMEIVEAIKRSGKYKNEELLSQDLEARINSIAASVRVSRLAQPGVLERREASVIDCYLYAQKDRYAPKSSEEQARVLSADQ